MKDMSLILPGPQGQIAVFREAQQHDNVITPSELILIQPERIAGNVLIPARTVSVKKIEHIKMLSNFLISVLASRPTDPY